MFNPRQSEVQGVNGTGLEAMMLDAIAEEPAPAAAAPEPAAGACHRQPAQGPLREHPGRVWYPRAFTPSTPSSAPPAHPGERCLGAGPSSRALLSFKAPLRLSRRGPGRMRCLRRCRALPAGPARGRCGPGGREGNGGSGGAGRAERRRDGLESRCRVRLRSSLVAELLISSGFPARCGAGGSALSSAAAFHPRQRGWAAEGAPGRLCCEGGLGEPGVLSLGKRRLLNSTFL